MTAHRAPRTAQHTPPPPAASVAGVTQTEISDASAQSQLLPTSFAHLRESIFDTLTSWYTQHARELPWRTSSTSPWGILVCEVMSQQTPVTRVAPVWTEWMARWPSPQALARASAADILVAWSHLGYPRRALRLLECAQTVVTLHGGELPNDRDVLLSLPGIGPYTADAVLAFAFQQYSVVLDTNIRRVLARWHGDALPAPHQTASEVRIATTFVPNEPSRAAQWNQAIMEFGALICTASTPKCELCPITEQCDWRKAGYPADSHASTRVTQKYAGTHRQARGAVMAVLKRHAEDVEPIMLKDLLNESGLSDERFNSALSSLISDGLAQSDEVGIRLPR